MKLVDNKRENQQQIKRKSCMNTIEVKQNVPEISKLSEIGKTYVYEDTVVIPSQYYAKFSGKETRATNQALDRISGTGRLAKGEDYFKLNKNMVTDCDHKEIQQLADPRYGITLITKKAVNTLSHYFDDERSIELSKSVNNIATKVMETKQSSLDNILLHVKDHLLIFDKIIPYISDNANNIQNLQTVDADHNLTSSQVSEIDALISGRYREYDRNGVVCGLIKRRIKQEFFDIPGPRTYKEIPRRGFERAKQIVRQWEPTLRQQEKYGLTIKRAGTGGDQ